MRALDYLALFIKLPKEIVAVKLLTEKKITAFVSALMQLWRTIENLDYLSGTCYIRVIYER